MTVIFYYSGTGNSLYVAREFQKRDPSVELRPMLREPTGNPVETEADVVGLVFPIYLTNIPRPVRSFLHTLRTPNARYTFFVATRIGTFTVAPAVVRKLLRKNGGTLDAFFYLNMASKTHTGVAPGKGDRRPRVRDLRDM